MGNGTSSLELAVIHILNASGVAYEREKNFKDLYNGLYRFDFFIPANNILIECQGAQHYSYLPAFHKKRSDFTKGQERDRRKIAYCLAHGYKLYCIPYWEMEHIKTFEDLMRDDFLAKSKFHNDEVWRHQNSK